MQTPTIGFTGQLICLRALGQEDLPLLHSWETDPDGWLSNGTVNPPSKDFIHSYISASTRHILETGSMSLIIEKLGTKEAIGHLVLYDYSPIHRRLAVGVYIDSHHRMQGFGSEAIGLATRYAFEKLRCDQVYAEVLAYNSHSQHMLSSLGFHHTATLPRWHWWDSRYEDLYYYQKWNE